MMTIRSPEPSEHPAWPSNCAEAQAVVFALRRRGVPLLPGITQDLWAGSVLAWSSGRTIRCVGVDEVAAA